MNENALIITNRAADGDDDQLPEWSQIEVNGSFYAPPTKRIKNREQLVDQKAIESIVESFESERKLQGEEFPGILVDRDHLSHDLDKPTVADGWLKEVRIGASGQLEGRVEWTPRGEQAILNREYKFFSTEYLPPYESVEVKDGVTVFRPVKLSGLSLTNRPRKRGAAPIANREDDQPSHGAMDNQTNEMNSKAIAAKLGLSEDATEDQILNRVGELQTEVDDHKKAEEGREVDKILNDHKDRIPEGQRDAWREQLITNRESGEKLLKGLPVIKKEEKKADRIHNRANTTQPGSVVEDDEKVANRAGERQALVEGIKNRESCDFNTAWNIARGQKPELFVEG